MHDYSLLFFHALLATVAIETLVLAAFFFSKMHSRKVFHIIFAGIVPSCITLPFVWFLIPAIIENRTSFIIIAESFAFIAEVPIIKGIVKTTWLNALTASFLANGASFVSGYLLGIS